MHLTTHRLVLREFDEGDYATMATAASVDVVAVMFGGSYPWIEQPGTAITCCTDGLRPVIFRVERIE